MAVSDFKVPEGSTSSSAKPAPWSDGIAIIGISARFPGARNVGEFWKKLEAGESFVSTLNEDDLRTAGVDAATFSRGDYVRCGGTLEDAEYFDAKFFGFNRREAEITDPQHRVFLETAWQALEDAGYSGYGDRIGVYAGVSINSYYFQMTSHPGLIESVGGYQLMLGNDKDFISSRVAYKLNLRGPAVVVQTACSTSLAAVHMACLSIFANECDMALAGGVSIPFPQGVGYPYIPGMILSPDGYCRPFDKEAKGTIPGRGAAVVVLKRLSQALQDEDSIYAVIRGSAWNNDGAGKIGYTAPSIEGQVAVIREAQRVAGINANRIGYVETHGTATELGDSIEIAALSEVFAGGKPNSCVLGALKANLGHADVAAGVAGLVKASLAIQAGVIPPTPNFQEPNPALHLDKGPFEVSSSKRSWPDDEERWAGVSSFGIGGTNIHVVLSHAPERSSRAKGDRARLFPVSARTEGALEKARERLATHLEQNPEMDLAAVASTLQIGRRSFEQRFAIVAKDAAELVAGLRQPITVTSADGSGSSDIVFLFPGQGAQFAGMAGGIYRADASFRKVVDLGAELVRQEFGLDLLKMIVDPESTGEYAEVIKETRVTQPLLFLVEYALAVRWRTLGVEPGALLGHSLGELTAASVAGVFSFEDGLRLAAERGRLMGQTPPGVMLAVTLAPESLAPYLGPELWLAAENGPRLSVVSGLPAAVQVLEQRLAKDRVSFIRLTSRNAFHSPLMADAAKAFREKVAAVPRSEPAIPWLSNVSGTWIDRTEAQNPLYWANQILSRVRFGRCLAALGDRPHLLLEVGPGEVLIGMARHQAGKSVGVPSLGAENRKKSDDVVFLEAAARLWRAGIDLVWAELHPDEKAQRVSLPTYPFEREKYWIGPAEQFADTKPSQNALPQNQLSSVTSPNLEKRPDISSWFYMPQWRSMPPSSVMPVESQTMAVNSWLILLDSAGIGQMLKDRLEKAGATVASVSLAQEFTQNGRQFFINPEEPGDYKRLWTELSASGVHPAGVICLWTIGEMAAAAFDRVGLLLQSARASRQRLLQIEVVTDRLEQVFDEKPQNIESSEVCGLMRVVPLESPGTQCRTMDADLAAGPSRVAEQIFSEMRSPGGAMAIAFRGNTRWQKEWVAAPLQKSTTAGFRKDGVYLITGGLGGIGYLIARHLLREYSARVVMTGRTALPPRERWSSLAEERETDDETSSRIRRMQKLEQSGGQVQYVTADVADREAMSGAIGKMLKSYGRINGVVHAAGLPGGRMIAGLDLAEAAQVRRPKVQGSLILADLLTRVDLDFLLFCSSISAVFPGPGQAAYAAANEFQNHFAWHCRKAYGLPAVAIDFDAWQEVGIAATMALPEGFEDIKQARMRTAMSPEEGIDVIERVLSGWPGPQILTSTVGLEVFDDWITEAATSDPLESLVSVESNPEVDAIVEIWSDLLADKNIGPTDNFFELGGHSLLGTMILSRVRERFGVTLTLRALFETPTPEGLTEQIRFIRNAQVLTASDTLESEEREAFEI
jgi:acyl transferase domain-containing protein